jgi:hypothetical protein
MKWATWDTKSDKALVMASPLSAVNVRDQASCESHALWVFPHPDSGNQPFVNDAPRQTVKRFLFRSQKVKE